MVAPRTLNPSSIFDENALLHEIDKAGAKPIHLHTVWSQLVANPDSLPHEVKDLPVSLRSVLESKFVILTSQVASQKTSSDGSTTKLVVRLQDGLSVECVIMRHNSAYGIYNGRSRQGNPRATLCISSQVGCQMGCKFCATGTMGIKGNLHSAEMIEQLIHACKITPIRNIVFMGMGEPLNNYNEVKKAIKAFTGKIFSLSPNHITVSTVGVIPKILSLCSDIPEVNLALSLHAPNQKLRSYLVPSARAYPLDKLLNSMDTYISSSGKCVLIEYVLLSDVNDSEETAHELGRLLKDKKVVVNLIPYNPTDVTSEFRSSSESDVRTFQTILREEYGIHTTVRKEMGRDIAGACGQLALTTGPSTKTSPEPSTIPDIEELGR